MPAHGLPRTRGVRWRKDTGFELWCPDCDRRGGVQTFWPITTEFWNVNYGLARCRACWADKKRRDERARKSGPKHEAILAANRAYYQENRDVQRMKDNNRKAARRRAA